MANVISDVFKEELLKGNHDFDGGATYKIALFTSSKTVSVSDPTSYNTTNQISGTNYTAGGNTLANPPVGRTGSTSFVDLTTHLGQPQLLQLDMHKFINQVVVQLLEIILF